MGRELVRDVLVVTCLLGCASNETASDDASAGLDGAGDAATDATASSEATGYSDATALGSDADGDIAQAEGGEGGARTCDPNCVDVLTWHNDNFRSGQNLKETILTPANVNSAQFGKLFVLQVDGKVDAQPLFVSALEVNGKGRHDVLFVATEHDSLYAFDANSNTGANANPLWQRSLLGSGETTSDDRGCNQVVPEIGITSTPVVDLATSTIYVVAMSKTATTYFQRLHAIDIASGAEKSGGPIDIHAVFPGTGGGSKGGVLTFDPSSYKERAALLLVDHAIYLTWASHCDGYSYNGWVMAYDASALQQRAVLNVTPNGSQGAIWGAGAGPAADGNGNIYFLDGNGTFDPTLDSSGFPAQRDFGNAMIKISTAGSLTVTDYFATYNTIMESAADLDFGSAGAMLLPDDVGGLAHPHLMVGPGKDGSIFLVDRDDMGKWNGGEGGTGDNKQIVQEVYYPFIAEFFSSPAYFDHSIYLGASGTSLGRFAIAAGRITTPAASQTALQFAFPGATPSVSANGAAPDPAATAIVWVTENLASALLHAYAATDLTRELYSSGQAPRGRDTFGIGNKFIVPTVANAHVYVGTVDGVGVFGELPLRSPAVIPLVTPAYSLVNGKSGAGTELWRSYPAGKPRGDGP